MWDMDFIPRPADAAMSERLNRTRCEFDGRVKYDWPKRADGRWWQMREGPADEPREETLAERQRVRTAARNWARRHGYRSEIRQQERGRLMWVRFTETTEESTP